MKATGIVRRIDDLGRIVIPKELRRTMSIKEGDPMEIFVDDGDSIVIKKYGSEECCNCHTSINLIKVDNTYICRTCAIRLAEKMRGLQG